MSDKVRHYADEEIDITYDSRRCIHVAECIRGLPAVFNTHVGRGSCRPVPARTQSLR